MNEREFRAGSLDRRETASRSVFKAIGRQRTLTGSLSNGYLKPVLHTPKSKQIAVMAESY